MRKNTARSRLRNLFTRPGKRAGEAQSERSAPCTVARELEELSWEVLLEDMDRFSARFGRRASDRINEGAREPQASHS